MPKSVHKVKTRPAADREPAQAERHSSWTDPTRMPGFVIGTFISVNALPCACALATHLSIHWR